MPRLTPEQIEQRSRGMGSTDVVRALKLSPYANSGPWDVWLEKTGQAKPRESTPEQEWGHTLEEDICDWYAEQLPAGHVVERSETLEHDNGWLMASPDRLVSMFGSPRHKGVEAKNVGIWMQSEWDEWVTDGVPHHVIGQVTIGMVVTGLKEWDVVASLGGTPPKVWTIAFDGNLADILVSEAEKFWATVKSRTPPPLDGSDACRAYLKKRYPRDAREMTLADAATDELARHRAALAKSAKRDAAMVKEIDSRLMARCADAKGLLGEGWKFTWKCGEDGVRRSQFTAKGLDE